MGRKERIGMFNDKLVARLRRCQIPGYIAHLQDQHPVFLKRISYARRKGAILDSPGGAGNHPPSVFQQPFQYLFFLRRMPAAEIDIGLGR